MSRRTLETRTTGLFRKGNALFRLQSPKVAIFIIPEGGQAQGYASHAVGEWPELHQAIGLLNIPPQNVLGPDNFETVADRQREPARSFSSGSLTIAPSVGEPSDSDRLMAEMLASVLDATSESDQAASTPGPMPGSGYGAHAAASLNYLPQRVGERPAPFLQHTPEPHELLSMQNQAPGTASSTHHTPEPHVSRSMQHTPEPVPDRRRAPEAQMTDEPIPDPKRWMRGELKGSSRRRKAADGFAHGARRKKQDDKRRRIMTRSQGGEAYIRNT